MDLTFRGLKFCLGIVGNDVEAATLDPTSFLDLAFLLVATVLTLLSVDSLRLLARIRLEKSLFIPVIMSAVFFWCSSFVNVVYNLGLQSVSSLIVFQEPISVLYHTMLLMGLSTLTYGVFSYWRLTRKVKLPKHETSEKHEEQQTNIEERHEEQQTNKEEQHEERQTNIEENSSTTELVFQQAA